MNRIFGSSSSRKPRPTLQDAISSVSDLQIPSSRSKADQVVQTDTRIASIEVKVKKLEGELVRYKEQMSKLRNGPGKVTLLFVLPAPSFDLSCGWHRTPCNSVRCGR